LRASRSGGYGCEWRLRASISASDAGGGVVGGVEFSVDGGELWHPAEADVPLGPPSSSSSPPSSSSLWVADFGSAPYDCFTDGQDPSVAPRGVIARAVDDSLNLGPASESRSLETAADETCDAAA